MTTSPTSAGGRAKQWLHNITHGESIAHGRRRKAEDFWPTTLDKEAKRAAKILRSFFMDGIVVPYRTMNKIPKQVVRHSKAILVFYVLRSGLRPEGFSGIGIIVARLLDGTWIPPSAVLINAAEWDFVNGADIYDGLYVQTHLGPVGDGPTTDGMVRNRSSTPCWTWVKGKSYWRNAKIDGTVVFERIGENERFYDMKDIQCRQILEGEVHAPTGPFMKFREVLAACELEDWSHRKLPAPGSPGEFNVKPPTAENLRNFNAMQGWNGITQPPEDD